MSLRQRIYVLFDEPTSGTFALNFSFFILTLVLISCATFVVETLPKYRFVCCDVV